MEAKRASLESLVGCNRQFLKRRYGTLNEARLISLRAVYCHIKVPKASRLIIATKATLGLAKTLRSFCAPDSLIVSQEGGDESWHLAHGSDAVMLYTIYSLAGSPPTLLLEWDLAHKALIEYDNVSLLLLDAVGVRPPAHLHVTTQRSRELWPTALPWDLGSLAAHAALLDYKEASVTKQCGSTTVAMRSIEGCADPRRDLSSFMLLAERHAGLQFLWLSSTMAEKRWQNVAFKQPATAAELVPGVSYYLARASDASFAFALLLQGVRVIFIEEFAVPVPEAWSPTDGGRLCGALHGRKLQHLAAADLMSYTRTSEDLEAAVNFVTTWSQRCCTDALWHEASEVPADG